MAVAGGGGSVVQGRVVNEAQRPGILVCGIEEDDAAVLVAGLAPRFRVIEDLDEVRQSEWDGIVCVRAGVNFYRLASHINVLSIGLPYLGRSDSMNREYGILRRELEVVSTELIEPPLSGRLLGQIKRDLLEGELKSDSHTYISESAPWAGGEHRKVRDLTSEVEPFLSTPDGNIMAGRFTREGGQSSHWVLPDYVDAKAWLALATEAWREQYPERFPPYSDWHLRAAWRTPIEDAAVEALEAFEVEEERILAELASRRQALEQAQASAIADATAHARRLLTAQGDDLVAVAIDCLTALGFDVRNMDAVWPERDRREDLRATHPSHAGWEAIVEVRGYGRGAQLSDLQRLTRFVGRYRTDEGRDPTASWYVVNGFIAEDPDRRDAPLASNPNEVAEFATGEHGLVIDTRELFKLWMATERGTVSVQDAARSLIGATGIYRSPEQSAGG